MKKVCLDSRDELVVIDVEQIAYIKADGNSCEIYYIGMKEVKLIISCTLSKMEELLSRVISPDSPHVFTKIGRSLIINQYYLTIINMARQYIKLSDLTEDHVITIREISKPLLRSLKALVAERYSKN